MSWPLSHEFNEAIQNPQTAFADPDLKTAEAVVGATGLPLPRSGNFADVYQVRGADGRDWAVKCFTRPVAGLAERYAKVSAALEKADLPFAVGFTFLADGIRVGGGWRPVVKMEWVEGLLLNQVVRENAGKPTVLSALGQMWVRLCKRLREAGVAHADVQHGNVLLVPGSRAGAYGLKLIDYDGMWVPALANTPSGEAGHRSYQHPARAAERAYSPDADRFPHLVVATALRGLSVGGSALWERYDNGDNLLFTEADFRAPAESELMRELWHTGNPAVQALVGRLAIACGKPIPQTPWLDSVKGCPTASRCRWTTARTMRPPRRWASHFPFRFRCPPNPRCSRWFRSHQFPRRWCRALRPVSSGRRGRAHELKRAERGRYRTGRSPAPHEEEANVEVGGGGEARLPDPAPAPWPVAGCFSSWRWSRVR